MGKWHCEKKITVYCSVCQERHDEKKCKFEDISEDIQGRDILTFTCPKGHEHQKSYRVG